MDKHLKETLQNPVHRAFQCPALTEGVLQSFLKWVNYCNAVLPSHSKASELAFFVRKNRFLFSILMLDKSDEIDLSEILPTRRIVLKGQKTRVGFGWLCLSLIFGFLLFNQALKWGPSLISDYRIRESLVVADNSPAVTLVCASGFLITLNCRVDASYERGGNFYEVKSNFELINIPRSGGMFKTKVAHKSGHTEQATLAIAVEKWWSRFYLFGFKMAVLFIGTAFPLFVFLYTVNSRRVSRKPHRVSLRPATVKSASFVKNDLSDYDYAFAFRKKNFGTNREPFRLNNPPLLFVSNHAPLSRVGVVAVDYGVYCPVLLDTKLEHLDLTEAEKEVFLKKLLSRMAQYGYKLGKSTGSFAAENPDYWGEFKRVGLHFAEPPTEGSDLAEFDSDLFVGTAHEISLQVYAEDEATAYRTAMPIFASILPVLRGLKKDIGTTDARLALVIVYRNRVGLHYWQNDCNNEFTALYALENGQWTFQGVGDIFTD